MSREGENVLNGVSFVAVLLRPGAPLPLQQPAPFVLVHACMVLKPARPPATRCSTGEQGGDEDMDRCTSFKPQFN